MKRLDHLLAAMRTLNNNPDPVSSINQYAMAMREAYGDQGLISVTTRGLAQGEYRVMRFLHQAGVADAGFVDTFFAGANAPVRRGGYIGEVIAGGKLFVDRTLRVPDDPIVGNMLSPYRVVIASPVYGTGPLTNWVLFLNTNPDAFTDTDVEARVLQANLMSGITTSKRATFDLQQATEQIQHEIDEIAQIMNGLLPESLPEVPGLEVAATFETFDRAGGDYYDLFPLPQADGGPKRYWGVMIADASGHGASAAVIVAMMSALLHSYPEPTFEPGAVLEHINQNLLHRQRGAFFVTGIFGVYDTETRQFEFSSAGHPPPLLTGEDAEARRPGQGSGLPLGIDSKAKYSVQRITLQSNDTLVLYTDGLTEAMSPSHELFGDDRFAEVVRSASCSATQLVEAVKKAVRLHQRGERSRDDQTMLVLKVME